MITLLTFEQIDIFLQIPPLKKCFDGGMMEWRLALYYKLPKKKQYHTYNFSLHLTKHNNCRIIYYVDTRETAGRTINERNAIGMTIRASGLHVQDGTRNASMRQSKLANQKEADVILLLLRTSDVICAREDTLGWI